MNVWFWLLQCMMDDVGVLALTMRGTGMLMFYDVWAVCHVSELSDLKCQQHPMENHFGDK